MGRLAFTQKTPVCQEWVGSVAAKRVYSKLPNNFLMKKRNLFLQRQWEAMKSTERRKLRRQKVLSSLWMRRAPMELLHPLFLHLYQDIKREKGSQKFTQVTQSAVTVVCMGTSWSRMRR